jgi:transcriptional regulator with XRE-family HTH domain
MEKSLGERLWESRRRLFMSQREAADRVGISTTYWSLIECGKKKPGRKLMERLKLRMGV